MHALTRRPLGLSLVLAALAIPSAARAQQPAPTDSTRAAPLDPVVVTAARVETPASAAPAATTVLSGDDLRARGIATVAEALRLVPGVALARGGSTGATTTLFLRGGERDYVKVLVDGVPANDPGGDFDFAHLSLADVERIEVVRGPASVLYGSDAVTGVVQIFTRRGLGAPALALEARAGSRRTRELEGSVAGGLVTRGGVRADGSVGVTRAATDGILPFNNDYRNTGVAAQAGIAGGGGSARLTMRRAEGTFHFPTDGAGVASDSNQYTWERRDVWGAALARALGARATAHLQLGATELDRISEDRPDSPGDTAGYYYRSAGAASRRSADGRVDVRVAPGALLTAGAAYERERERSDGTASFGTFPLEPTRFDEARHTSAAYAQLLAARGARASLAVSARVDRNSRFGTFRTARAAGTIALGGRTRLRAAVGNAYKAPAFSETFSTAFTIGREDLRPERTRSVEAGVERRALDDRLTMRATWFDQRFRDLVLYVNVDRTVDPATPNYSNLGGATARGLELEASLAAGGALDVGASATWLRTRVTRGEAAGGAMQEGERLLRRPAFSGTLSLRWRPAPALSLGATGSWTGRRDDIDFGAGERVVLPGHALVDLSARWALPVGDARRALALTARVENALDRRYQSVLGFDAPGRLVLLGASATLGR